MYPRTPDDHGVAPSPDFPAVEREVLAFWKQDGTFQASIDQREGAHEWVFYDGPPFANGLPHYGHLLTGLRQGPLPALPDHARQAGAPPLRLGHARPARRARGRAPARHHRQERDRGDGHRGLQRGRARGGAALHRGVAGVRHPPGALGRLRARLQDARRDVHGVAWSGRSRRCTTRASPTRATACCRTAGATRRRCRTTSCAWTTTSTRCGRTRRSRSRSRSRARRPSRSGSPPCARSPGRRRRGRSRRTSRSRSAPTSSTPSCPPGRTARPTRRCCARPRRRAPTPRCSAASTSSRVDLVGGYAKELGYDSADDARAAVSRTVRGAELEGVTYDRLFDYYADVEQYGLQNAWQVLVADYVTTEDGTGIVHQAPAYGEEDQKIGEAAGIPVDPLARRRRPLPAGGRRMSPGCSGATRTSRSRSCSRPRAACSARRATSTRTRTAGGAATRSSTRRSRAGSCACPSSATAWAS